MLIIKILTSTCLLFPILFYISISFIGALLAFGQIFAGEFSHSYAIFYFVGGIIGMFGLAMTIYEFYDYKNLIMLIIGLITFISSDAFIFNAVLWFQIGNYIILAITILHIFINIKLTYTKVQSNSQKQDNGRKDKKRAT